MTLTLILGLLMTVVTLVFAGRRVRFLYDVITSGQPAPDRIEGVTHRLGTAVKTQLVEVLGQKKLLKWSIPGAAHLFVMYAFIILATVYFEAYAVLFTRDPGWNWFVFGNWSVLGFLQDFIAVMCFLGIVTFAIIRYQNSPERLGRKSRFSWSHLGGAWMTLFMIFNVLWTLFLFRGAVEARDMGTDHGYGKAAFVSYLLGKVLPDSTALIAIGLLLHIGVMLAFLILVLNSKHLHIFIAPLNVMFGRRPVALGAAKPLMSEGKPVSLDDIEDMDEDTTLGVGKVEDFSWKAMLDFASCTECGRCQSQCPAWNTEKPLSPKLLIMGLRDHALQKAPYLLADSEEERAKLAGDVLTEAERPLVGETEGEWAWEPTGGAVIDDDVLWSCTSCGACVQQCPVDIEHVDHIIDMRRYQVLVEANFPAELNQLFKGLENKGNPWNMNPRGRLEWAQGLDFDVPVVGEDVESLEDVDWLFWVGCAGAYEDRAKKTTRAVAELLNIAGVDFAVLGNGETCTGDPARRAGNEFVFQGLATQNAEVLKESGAKKVVATCAHCFNTLKNEYAQFGVELEVVHHTQLLNRLVREKKLTPVAAQGASRSITYHDPCYLGRHNQVYSPPRELLQIIPGAEYKEMPRNSERSFCCGAGGARMWMEETIGERVNVNRTREAVATGAEQIAVGCPFCRVMLADGLVAEQQDGNAREDVEVLDVAQMLLASVKGETPVKKTAKAKVPAGAGAAGGATAAADAAVAAEPSSGDATQTEDTVTDTADVGPAAKASGGGSLFDTPAQEEPAAAQEEPAAEPSAGEGSLFDVAPTTEESAPAEKEAPAAEAKAETSGGSLFDFPSPGQEEPTPAEKGQAEAVAEEQPVGSEPENPPTAAEAKQGGAAPVPGTEVGSGSLFDIAGPAEGEPAEGTTAEPVVDEAPQTAEVESEPEAAAAPEGAAPEAGAEPEEESGSEAETERAAEPESSSGPTAEKEPAGEAGQASTSIPEGGSLFDIKAAVQESQGEKPTTDNTADEPADQPADRAAEEPAETAETAEEPAAEPAETAEEAADAPDEQPEADADAEPAEGEQEKPKPSASGEAHQPKTDADISGTGSLFDL